MTDNQPIALGAGLDQVSCYRDFGAIGVFHLVGQKTKIGLKHPEHVLHLYHPCHCLLDGLVGQQQRPLGIAGGS